METWLVAAILMVGSFVVLALLPGAPVKGTNRYILGGGSLAIIIGFILLSQGPVSNPMSMTYAPVLLVLGYCVIIPISLLRRPNGSNNE
jgi:hypothetical protein